MGSVVLEFPVWEPGRRRLRPIRPISLVKKTMLRPGSHSRAFSTSIRSMQHFSRSDQATAAPCVQSRLSYPLSRQASNLDQPNLFYTEPTAKASNKLAQGRPKRSRILNLTSPSGPGKPPAEGAVTLSTNLSGWVGSMLCSLLFGVIFSDTDSVDQGSC